MSGDGQHPLGVPGGGGEGTAGAHPDASRSGVNALDRWLARRIMQEAGNPPVSFALWDGQDVWSPGGDAAGRIVIRDRGALWTIVRSPELGFGDCYSAGRIEIEGDLIDVLYRAYRAMDGKASSAFKKSILGRLPRGRQEHPGRVPQAHPPPLRPRQRLSTASGSTSAWSTPAPTTRTARRRSSRPRKRRCTTCAARCVSNPASGSSKQAAAGVRWRCTWARHYGVKVRAFNISHEQVAYARERAARSGLDSQVEFVEDDYRNISGKYDAFVSVGMLEHVGPDHYETLGEVIARSLEEDGLGIVHSVGRSRPSAVNAWLEQRIFPGSYPPSLREMMSIFEGNQFSIIDIENLRLHYAKTLMEWLARFDANVGTVRQWYDEAFVRAWRLYLGGCAAAFLSSSIQLFQVVFTHRCHNSIAHTREHLYRPDANGADWSFG